MHCITVHRILKCYLLKSIYTLEPTKKPPESLSKCICRKGPLLRNEGQMLIWVAVRVIVQAFHLPV